MIKGRAPSTSPPSGLDRTGSALARGGADHETRLAEAERALATVLDPELDEPVTALGFVSGVTVEDDDVAVAFRLPTYWCSPNFAWIMAEDMRGALLALPWVRRATVTLADHLFAGKINAAVNRGDDFGTAFADAGGDLAGLRATFRRKAYLGRMATLIDALRAEGRNDADVTATTVGDLRRLSSPEPDHHPAEGHTRRSAPIEANVPPPLRSGEDSETGFGTRSLVEPGEGRDLSDYGTVAATLHRERLARHQRRPSPQDGGQGSVSSPNGRGGHPHSRPVSDRDAGDLEPGEATNESGSHVGERPGEGHDQLKRLSARYLELRAAFGGRHGDGDAAFRTPEGEDIAAAALPLFLRGIRMTRRGAEANGEMCRIFLRERALTRRTSNRC